MTRAVLHDGRVLEFPDGTDPAVIQRTVKSVLSGAAFDPRQGQDTAVPDTAPAPLPFPDAPEATAGAPSVGRSLMLGTQDVGRGLADLAGAPVDLMSAAMNAPIIGFNALVPDEFETDFRFRGAGGSQDIQQAAGQAAEAAGVPLVDRSTLSGTEELIGNINRLGSGSVATGGAALPLAGSSRVAAALAPKTGGNLVTDLAAGMGAGAGLTAGETVAPDSPITQLITTLLGGLLGGKGAQVAQKPAAAAEAVAQRLTQDPQTGTTESVAQRAAELAQNRATDPQAAAANIRQRVAEAEAPRAGDLDDPVATSGLASDDIGLTALEKGARLQEPVPFQEADEAVRVGAREKVESIRDPEARPEAAREAVEADVAAQRAKAQEPIAQEQTELQRLRDENAALIAERETAREASLAEKDVAIAEKKVEAGEARQAEKDVGGEVAGRAGTEGAASEEIAQLTAAAKAGEEARKAGLYDRATELGKKRVIDPEPLAAEAQSIKDEIGPLAQQDSNLNNILRDLDNLTAKKLEDTGEVGSDGQPIMKEVEQEITAADLIEMVPRLATARESAVRLRRGDLSKRLKSVTEGIKGVLDDLAAQGDEAGLAFQKAERNFKENFAPKFREGVGGQLDKASRGSRPVQPTEVGAKFLKAGAGGKEAAADLKRILKEEGAKPARDFVLADMAGVVGADGAINPSRLRSWIDKRSGMFEQLPALKAEAEKVLSNVINKRNTTTKLQRELETSVAERKGADVSQRKAIDQVKRDTKLSEQQKKAKIAELERGAAQVERDINASATRLLIGTDPAKAVTRVLGSNDPRGAMREIVGKLKGDKAALAGWKRAVSDHVIDSVKNARDEVTIAKLQQMFQKNERAMAQVFSPAEMNALRRSQKMLEPFGNQARQAVTGSPTIENKAFMNQLEAGLLAVTGNAITAGMVMKRIKVVAGLLPSKNNKAKDLIMKMYFDPELAVHLLEKNVKQINSPQWNRKLTLLLGLEQAAQDKQ